MNSSSSNVSFLNLTDNLALLPYPSIFISVFLLLPMLIIKILILVAIITAKKVPSTIRLILGNIVASSELIIIGVIMYGMYGVSLLQLEVSSPHDFPCRLVYVIIDIAQV